MNISPIFKSSDGFTLMEIIIAFVIMAAIVGFAMPKFTLTIERSRSGEGIEILQALHNAQEIYKFENGSYATGINQLDVEIPSPIHFKDITDSQIDSSNPIATVVRSNGEYSLSINDDGSLNCSPGTSSFCVMLGY